MKILIMILFITFISMPADARESYDSEKGSSVEIEKGNPVRTGDEGENKSVQGEDIDGSGGTAEAEASDDETDENGMLEEAIEIDDYIEW